MFIGAIFTPVISSNINENMFVNNKKGKNNQLTQLDITDGLVGFWNFNEGSGNIANDSSGFGNHGTIENATWTTGISGSALHFNGDDAYVNCGNDETLQIPGTISVGRIWARRDSNS